MGLRGSGGCHSTDSQVCSHFHPPPCDSSPRSPPPTYEESPLVSEVPFTWGAGAVCSATSCAAPQVREMKWQKAALLCSTHRCSFGTYCVPGMSLNSKIHSEQNKVSVLLKLGGSSARTQMVKNSKQVSGSHAGWSP